MVQKYKSKKYTSTKVQKCKSTKVQKYKSTNVKMKFKPGPEKEAAVTRRAKVPQSAPGDAKWTGQ